jgi:pimeloyl-ACP methyl ester carboxylesterase
LPEVRDVAPEPLSKRYRTWFESRGRYASKSPPIYASVSDGAERMARQFPQLPRDFVHRLAEFSMRELPGGLTWKFDHRTRSRPPLDSDGRDFDAFLSEIRCPVLLFYGDQSFVPLPQSRRLALLSNVTLVRYADAGHWLHHEQLNRFAADTLTFLEHERAALA